MSKKDTFVVCAAIRNPANGRVIAGPRHFDPTMMAQMAAHKNAVGWRAAEQGFIDQHGAFLTRAEAWAVAEAAGQIRFTGPGYSGPELFSENLY